MGAEGFKGASLSTLLIVSLMVLAILLLSAGSSSAAPGGLTPRAPIYIEGNDNFTATNGVTSGSGTENDPYIIENWAIDASTAHGIWIKNTTAHFIVRNCLVENGSTNIHGIYLENVVNGRVEDSVFSNNGYGIVLGYSDNNTLSNNTCLNNSYGIWLGFSDNSTLDNNTCLNNGWGIVLNTSSNNTLDNNLMENNTLNFSVNGSSLSHFLHDVDTSNLVNGKPVRYLIDNHDEVIGPSLSIGYLALVGCDNIRVENLVLENNGAGVFLAFTENSRVENSVFSNNYWGTVLSYSDNNTISNTTCSNNNSSGIDLANSSNNILNNNICSSNYDGIDLSSSSNNLVSNNIVENNSSSGIYLLALPLDNNHIYHNNFIGNTQQAIDIGTNNWDNGYPSGGNYWSDYTGVDNYQGENQDIPGSDGIGDTPYDISGGANQDRYPLMNPVGGDTTPPAAPTLMLPANGSITSDNTPTFDWSDVADPSGVTYALEIVGALTKTGLTASTYTLTSAEALADGTYSWHVRAVDGAGNVGDWSATWSLTIKTVVPPPPPPNCVIELRKDGAPIDEINVGEFFDIYVGGSTGDIKEVRFSSDDSQDGVPTGEWTEEWYDWNTSSGDWDAETKIKKWSFATGGEKEVWAEVKDGGGNIAQGHANIFALIPEIVFRPPYKLSSTGGWSESHLKGDAFYYSAADRLVGNGNIRVGGIVSQPGGDGKASASFILEDYWKNEWSGTVGIATTFDISGFVEWASISFPPPIPAPGEVYIGITLKASLWVCEWPDATEIWRKELFIYDQKPEWKLISIPESEVVRYRDTQYIIQGFIDLQKDRTYSWHFEMRMWTWVIAAGIATGFSAGDISVELIDVCIGPPVLRPEPEPVIYAGNAMVAAKVCSPVELRVYDSQGQVTGLVNGEIKEEIPYSFYNENTVVILSPFDIYRYEVIGTDEGSYGLVVISVENGETTTFTTTNIPTTSGATHQYTIDWDALSRGEKGVTVQIDADGDGEFERGGTADNELTSDEFEKITHTPLKLISGIIFVVALIALVLVVVKR